MTARALLVPCLLLAISAAAVAQTPPRPPATPAAPAVPQTLAPPQTPQPLQPPAPPVPPVPPETRAAGQAANVRVDLTITDQRGGAPAQKKTVTVVTADAMSGRIRSQTNYSVIGEVTLNVDAEAYILSDGKVRVRVNLQYDVPGSTSPQVTEVPNAGAPRRTQVQENLSLILENGKPLVAAQSADPVSDRQVTIELKATVLR